MYHRFVNSSNLNNLNGNEHKDRPVSREFEPTRKRITPKRQANHPYSRYMPEFSLTNRRGSYIEEQRLKTDDYSCVKNKYLGIQRYQNRALQDSSTEQHLKPVFQAKAISQGHAEQLRRSKESNTFALIDSQLSRPPLDRARELYLQAKNMTSNNNAPRTTKKANLSAVHAIVRFRMRDYLFDFREHSRRLMEQLLSLNSLSIHEPNKDLEQIYNNISTLPCQRECIHCERLHTACRSDRSRLQHPTRKLGQSQRFHLSLPSRSGLQITHKIQNNSSLSKKDPVDDSQVSVANANLPMNSMTDETPSSTTYDHSSIIKEQKVLWLTSIDEFSSNRDESKSSYNDFKNKRNRIDSNVSRFCQELGLSAMDWSMPLTDYENIEYRFDESFHSNDSESKAGNQHTTTSLDDTHRSPPASYSRSVENQDTVLLINDVRAT